MIKIKKERYDYFVIWGHGLKFKEEILKIIREKPNLQIIAVKQHSVKNIETLVKAVYSYDYAPFKHLIEKTKYLLSTEANVLFVFVRNTLPREKCIGENPVFKHEECMLIKSTKEEIRDRFNERKGDRRTEDHVVHASDNQSQTDYILKYLGYKEGVDKIRFMRNSILTAPYHLSKFEKFVVKEVNLSDLYCNISTGPKSLKLCRIQETPHFRFLIGDTVQYEEYRLMVESFLSSMMDDQFPSRYMAFASSFKYLKAPYSTSYILTRKLKSGKYVVSDGVHRVAILSHSGVNNCIVAVME